MNKKVIVLALCTGVALYAFKTSKHTKPQATEKENMSPDKVTLPSGLSYKILKPSDSQISPEVGSTVTVHYTGYLDNNGEEGKEFDSSVGRGKPFSFIIGVGQVIKGWDEGVMSMKVGEKRRLYIPAVLGYGARGAGAVIPPHANLIFDVELIKVS
jgi:peptidylprolyl isomerase